MTIREHVSVGELRRSSGRHRPERFLYKGSAQVSEAWMRRTTGRRGFIQRPPRTGGLPTSSILGRLKGALTGNYGMHPSSNEHYSVTSGRSVNRRATKYHGFCKVGGCTFTASRFPAAQGKFAKRDPVGPLHQAMSEHLSSAHKIGPATPNIANTSAPASTSNATWSGTPVKVNKPAAPKQTPGPRGGVLVGKPQPYSPSNFDKVKGVGLSSGPTMPKPRAAKNAPAAPAAPSAPSAPAAAAAPTAMKTPVSVRGKKVGP